MPLNQVFNCGTNRMITYKGLTESIHKALGNDLEKDVKYLFYEPKDFDHWDGSGVMEFPFRRDTFVTTPNKVSIQNENRCFYFFQGNIIFFTIVS